MDIANTNLLVTGAASGLGESVVRLLVQKGARVIMADLNAERGAQIATELGDPVRFIKTDITQEHQVQAAIDQVLDRWGPLHGLVNCAGIPGGARVLGKKGMHDLSMFQQMINVNLVGTFNVIRLAANAMQHTPPNEGLEQGVIINTASIAACEGQIGQAAYAASKAGITGMTLPIARELAAFGIRVMTIAPGLFRTPMMSALPEEVQTSLGESVPFPARLGDPDEFARLATDLRALEALPHSLGQAVAFRNVLNAYRTQMTDTIQRHGEDPAHLQAISVAALEATGVLAGGWQLARAVVAAQADQVDADYRRNLHALLVFYNQHWLPLVSVHLDRMAGDGAGLTAYDFTY